MFTKTYSQPEGYHFCQDSILLARLVADLESTRLNKASRILDLCAGCGVVGFELKHYVAQIGQIDFLEVQPEFKQHVETNAAMFQSDEPFYSRWIEMNYQGLQSPEFTGAYDLIVSNPPYFFTGEGRLSPSNLNNRCRFFIDSDFATLIESTVCALKPEGRAYLLVKSGDQHGRNAVREAKTVVSARAETRVIGDVRGTSVVLIEKP